MLQQIDNQCQALCVRSHGEPSVLQDSSVGALEGVKWNNIMLEMKDRAPDKLDFIATVATPRLKKNVDEKVPPVCMIYAMMMNHRGQELSLIQKIATMILRIGHSKKKNVLNLWKLSKLQFVKLQRQLNYGEPSPKTLHLHEVGNGLLPDQ